MILLDTHALVWWVADGGQLSPVAAESIRSHHPVVICPISFWELAMLVDRQRVAIDRDLSKWVRDLLSEGVEVTSVAASTAILAARLEEFHGDPADRFIYASARELGVPLVSKDRAIRDYAGKHRDVQVVW